MKKNLLLGTLMLMGVYSTIQSQNVIVNGDFEDGTTTTFPEITNIKDASVGVWNCYDKNTAKKLTVSCINDDTPQGKVAKLATTGGSWFSRYFMQKLGTMEPKVYKLSMDIKSTSAKKAAMSALIYIKDNNYILINDFNPIENLKGSPSRKDQQGTETWTNVSCEFDFSRMSNNVNSVSGAAVAIGPSPKEMLSDCYLAIFERTADTTNLFIDNVKLEPIANKQPIIINKLTLYNGTENKWSPTDGTFAKLQSYANNPELVAIDMTNISMPVFTEGYDSKNVLTPANPNCLIYIKEKAIPHTSWKNVVTGNKATEINLVDNDGNNTYYPFENSVAFTADKITYTRNYPRAGSSSICLPFAVTNLPDGIGIEKFAGSTGTTVNFEDAGTTLDANTPYLIKINTTGDKVFEGTNAAIGITRGTSTEQNPDNGNYRFKGTLENIPDATGLYILDPQGTGFAKGTNQNFIPAFRAYMTSASTPSGAPKLSIARDGGATSINTVHNPIRIQPVNNGLEITTAEAQNIRVHVHTFDGRLIKDITVGEGTYTVTGLAKGIYLVNGQKIVVE